MQKETANVRITVDESIYGDVVQELSRRGAWVTSMHNDGKVIAIEAEARTMTIADFTSWLIEHSSGTGSVVELS